MEWSFKVGPFSALLFFQSPDRLCMKLKYLIKMMLFSLQTGKSCSI